METSLLDSIESGFSSAVSRLQNAASQFTGAYNQFVNIPVQYRTENWQTVKNRADTTRAIIQSFTNAVDTAYNWVKSAFGMDGLGSLGLIPAVPWLTVAAIGGAISAIMVSYSYMVEELNKSAYRKQIDEINAQRARDNLPPLSEEFVRANDPTLVTDLASLAKWLVIGGAVVFLVPKILEKWKGR